MKRKKIIDKLKAQINSNERQMTVGRFDPCKRIQKWLWKDFCFFFVCLFCFDVKV